MSDVKYFHVHMEPTYYLRFVQLLIIIINYNIDTNVYENATLIVIYLNVKNYKTDILKPAYNLSFKTEKKYKSIIK